MNIETDNFETTYNSNIPIFCVNVPEEKIDSICYELRNIFSQLGGIFDISSLKSLSIGFEDVGYIKAIERIDDSRKPSDGEVIGCAMTLTSINDGVLESHIVLKDISIIPLILHEEYCDKDERTDHIRLMLQVLAHECGHIHADAYLKDTFGYLDKSTNCDSHYAQIITNVSTVGWSEFAACYFSAHIGKNPELEFREIIKSKLDVIENQIDSARLLSHNPLEMMSKVFFDINSLIKYSSYYIGWMMNIEFSKKPEETELYECIEGSWFIEFFLKLYNIYDNIICNFLSKNPNYDEIFEIGALAIEICNYFDFEINIDHNNRTYFYTL